MLRVGVYGVGAIGGVLCGKLAPYASIYAIIKPNKVEDLCRNGISIENDGIHRPVLPVLEKSNDDETHTIQALTMGQTLNKPLDALIVSVKSTATRDVGTALQSSNWIDKNSVVISLQNGIGNQDLLARSVPVPAQVLQGVTYLGATAKAAHTLTICGSGKTILSGSNDSVYQRTIQRLAQLFESSGLSCSIADPNTMQSILWTKLIVNAAINPLAALLNGPNKCTIGEEDVGKIMRSIVDESVRVTRAHGIALDFPTDDPFQAVVDVAEATGENICSMLTDLRNGKRTEIEVMNQAIVSYGQQANIATPYNEMMVNFIHALERQKNLRLLLKSA